MALSFRLETVKNTVKPCKVAMDIGCDHGFVSIALINEGKAEHVIACDVNKGPLEAAKNNIAEAGLSDKIETRLSDGLHNTTVEDNPDAIVIAGMGGALMERILSEGEKVVLLADQLILQPQSEIFLVRKWLRNNGYNIVSEVCLLDLGKYYFVINAMKGETHEYEPELQEVYDTYSEYLITNKDKTLREYLQRGLELNNGYMAGIVPDRQKELQRKNQIIEKALSLMEG